MQHDDRLSSISVDLPTADRKIETYRLAPPPRVSRQATGRAFNRIAFSAAHVVADPLRRHRSVAGRRDRLGRDRSPIAEHLWDLGLGVAEAMDTAQRGMGLDWPTLARPHQALARRGKARARRARRLAAPAPIISRRRTAQSLDDVIRAYEEQMAAIEALGGRIILMASRALAHVAAQRPTTTRASTTASCGQVREPVIIHWLGDMFDPALAGYWGDARCRTRRWTRRSTVIDAQCRQDRRREDLAARQGQGDRDAPPAAART